MKYILYGFIAWNFIVFMLYGLDKRKAMKNKWRISETTLILTAFFMGGLGAFVGMYVFSHKTKHIKFKILVPMSILFNISDVIGFYYMMKGGFLLGI